MTGVRLGVLVNPTSGHGRGAGRGADVLTAFRRRGHTVVDLSTARLPPADEVAARAAEQGVEAIVVVGGDGMVHLGANVVAGTGMPLGIVAAGSGNDIARALRLPHHDVEASVRRIEEHLETGARAVDAVLTERLTEQRADRPTDERADRPTDEPAGRQGGGTGEWFLGVLSCGIDAAANARANELTWPPGGARYIRALGSVLGSFRPYGYRITLDDQVWESPGTLVAVANTPWFGGGIKIAPDAEVDDGLLDVVVAGPFTRRGVVAIFPGMYRGRHLRHPAVRVLRSTTVLIEPGPGGPTPPVAFSDGERLGPLPLRAQVRPGAVQLLG